MRKWTPAALVALGYAFSALVYSRLPAELVPEWDALTPWTITSDAEAMPRLVVALLMPTMALITWLLLTIGASPAAERLGRRVLPDWWLSERTGAAAIERFEPTFILIVTSVVAFMILFHVVTLGLAIGWPAWTLQLFTAAIGAGIVVLGNVMPRTRPNWIAGLRTRRTLSDPDLWRRTHRYFGALLMVAGLAMIVASAIAPRHAVIIGMAGFFVAATVAVVVASTGGEITAGRDRA